MPPLIKPRTLKGFRDYLPETMLPREAMMQTAREVFRGFGYAPIDTPVLEHLEILTGKGSEETDRQMYRFQDNGKRDVGMRFDLTVPLARFAAQHFSDLAFPFKRYHIAPVYRGENTQAGRYREFVQCDFDIVGTDSVVADIETVAVIDSLLRHLGLRDFTIRINHRGVLSGLLASLDLQDRSTEVLRCLDKFDKIGREAVAGEMQTAAGLSSEQADQVLALTQCTGTPEEVLARARRLVSESETGLAAIDRLDEVHRGAVAAGVDSARMRLDVSIARGLDYYTGVVFETVLDELPGIGSVCSGGRYDNLAGLYTKQHLPGIGASLGLDRLVAAVEELGRLPQTATPAPVMVAMFDAQFREDYLMLASRLRAAGIGTAVYPDAKKLGVQLKYAEKLGFPVAVIAGPDEWGRGVVQVKNLTHRMTNDVTYQHDAPESLIEAIQEQIASNG